MEPIYRPNLHQLSITYKKLPKSSTKIVFYDENSQYLIL